MYENNIAKQMNRRKGKVKKDKKREKAKEAKGDLREK